LRGHNMKDLIFAASDKYGPGAWAEVSLILGNEEGRYIHINSKVMDPSEIQLTRKLYRNGETEYRINNIPCRLKDIQEVFMDTGAGAKSYSVIAQGEVERLVQAKPPERRTMIEEVAGITKFKARRKESLRKIEQAQNNLERLIDLKSEVKKGLDSLQEQAQKANIARELKEKIEESELVVNAHKEFDVLTGYIDYKNQFNERSMDIEKWKIQKENLELDIENKKNQRMELTDQVEELQKEYNGLSNNLATMEERVDHLSFNRTEKQSFIESRQKESKEFEKELMDRKERLVKLGNEKRIFEEGKNSGSEYALMSGKVDSLKEQFVKSGQEYRNIKLEIETMKDRLNQTENSIEKVSSRMEESLLSLEDTTQEISSLESQYANTIAEIEQIKKEVRIIKDKQEKVSSEKEKISLEINNLKEQKKKIELEYQEKFKEMARVESFLKSLKDLNESLEGVSEGTSEFLKSDQSENYHILGNLLQSEAKYSVAVQKLIDPIVDVLIDVDKTHKIFFNWQEGRVKQKTELLGSIQEESSPSLEELKFLQNFLGANELIALERVVKIKNNDMADRIRPLLKGLYIADELNAKELVNTVVDVDFKMIISVSGEVLLKKRGKSLIVGIMGEEKAQGLIERNSKIAKLDLQLQEIKKEVDIMAVNKKDIDGGLEKIQKSYDELNIKNSKLLADYSAQKAVLDTKQASFSSGDSRIETLKKRKETILNNREKMIEDKDRLKALRQEQQVKLDVKQKKIIEYNKKIESLEATYNWEKEALLEKRIEEKSIDERFGVIANQIKDIEEQIVKEDNRLQTNLNLIEQYTNDIQNISKELTSLTESNMELKDSLSKKQQIISEKKDEMGELNDSIEIKSNELEELIGKLNKVEKNLVQMEGKMARYIEDEERITRDVFEKYQVNLRRSLSEYLKIEKEDLDEFSDMSSLLFVETENGLQRIKEVPYQFNRIFGKELKQHEKNFEKAKAQYVTLGDINWQAVKDYEIQKSRLDFLSHQEKELDSSVKDLEKAIIHIDEKSKERFKIAFNEVNGRFEQVFPIIFGGGSAKLKIVGDIADPECGVDIVARPPGKKMQVMDLLSGGEKALTAVSLIFSIFLVKPSPFCLLDEVDAPLDDANVGRFNELLREIGKNSQFILITHNKRTMELNDALYGVTMQEPGISRAVSVHLQQ
ncbi:MAG: chromosome segregation protein SMC, partial [Halobacteriovoraceae bacterium]|nr:chromosome segregation protein SMC [Halobacteriovoraceae bacterium]